MRVDWWFFFLKKKKKNPFLRGHRMSLQFLTLLLVDLGRDENIVLIAKKPGGSYMLP